MKSAATLSCGILLVTLLSLEIQEVGAAEPFLNFKPFKAFGFKSRGADETSDDFDERFETKVETPLLGEYIIIREKHLIMVQGVGLVMGLDGTGGDPSPSPLRTALADDMRRRQVKPGQLLRSPNTALVIVRAYVPVLVDKGERFDIEVRLPKESNASNLQGGYLMETYLTEQAIVPGRGVLKGFAFAKAKGPVLIAPGDKDDVSLAGVMQRGRVLAGGTSLRSRDLKIYLRNDFKYGRMSQRVAKAIGERFFAYNRHGLREELAQAKTDQEIVLKIQPRYKDNYPRYLKVIRNIARHETDVARQVRMQQLQRELQNPEKAELASLRLEAIGDDAIPALRTGLKHPALEVRFHSASALAYLRDTEGLPELAEAVREEPAFRVHALAAMSASDDAEAAMLLRELLNETSIETRYGAFRALTTLDKNDPFVRGEDMNGEFRLHTVHGDGGSLIHLTNHRKAEVVVFGADQEVRPPMVVRAGNQILVKAEGGAEKATLSRFSVSGRERRMEVSLQVDDIIRAAVELGATYPDIAQMLTEADRQHNLQGQFAIDALPEAGRIYYRPSVFKDQAEVSATDRKSDSESRKPTADDAPQQPQGAESGDESFVDSAPSGLRALDPRRLFRRE